MDVCHALREEGVMKSLLKCHALYAVQAVCALCLSAIIAMCIVGIFQGAQIGKDCDWCTQASLRSGFLSPTFTNPLIEPYCANWCLHRGSTGHYNLNCL